MKLTHLMVAVLALGACGGDTDDTGTDTDTSDTTPDCLSSIDEFFPADGATGVFFKTPIEVYFGDASDSTGATLSLADGAGAAVAGTTTISEDGESAAFTPSADLMPSTEYTLTVSYECDKTATATFSTSATGAPVDANSLVGNVYNIDLGSGRITEPPGVGDILAPLIADAGVFILVSPSMVDGTQITMSGALGVDDGTGLMQDMCTESIAFPVPADYAADPFFTISGENVTISVEGFNLSIAALDLSGAFAPGGASVEGMKLDAFADTSGLGAALDLGDDPMAVCGLLTGFGVSCVDCGDGNATCLKLVVDSLVAPLVPGIDGLEMVTTQMVLDNPACAAE